MKKQIFKTFLALTAIIFGGVFLTSMSAPDVALNTVNLSVDLLKSHTIMEASSGGVLAFAAPVALNQLAEKELVKNFRHSGTWMSRIPSKNQWVGNDVIKLNEMGADPEVLINNNTYPIPVNERTDGSTPIALFKYDTTNTKISDDELHALPYDKNGSVQMQHRETLEEKTQEHGLHSLAPVANTTDTPVIETTGANDGTGRKRLIYKDLVNLKTKLDKLKVPKKGRCLVLAPEHIADLLLEDKALEVQYNNHKEGSIVKNYCGFEIFEDIFAPEYNATLNKIPFGSATAGREASVLFLSQRTAKARGTVQRYIREAKNDPENRQSTVGFRLWHLVVPTSLKGQGAIVSATV